ncbi:MAG: GntR family transcriptional regulator [Bacteroidetes bacterium]|nr:MAG: GntR family transcriptional regulator [Bacteroidota bacterium]
MEIKIGQYNTMRVVKTLDFGIYLDGGEMGEILMPTKWVPEGTEPEDEVEVFIYFDSEDRPIATTTKPKAQVGEFAWMKVKAVDRIGAFLDWGLDKDLLVPFKEQNAKMEEGRSYLVYLYVDTRSNRIAASARLEKYLDIEPVDYIPGQEVDLIIWTRTDIGYKAIINQKHQGLLYTNEIFQDIRPGQKLKGYISQLRPDGKIDIKLQQSGYENVIDDFSKKLIVTLKANEGFLPLTDKSSPEDIYQTLQMSKKNFKKAVGSLYKQRIIAINEMGIGLVNQ